jgi:hypothetical protein
VATDVLMAVKMTMVIFRVVTKCKFLGTLAINILEEHIVSKFRTEGDLPSHHNIIFIATA